MPYFPPVVLRSGALAGAVAQAQEFMNGVIANAGADIGIPIIAKAFSTLQTANLQEWQSSSGAVRSKMTPNGNLTLRGGTQAADTYVISASGAIAFNTSATCYGVNMEIQQQGSGLLYGGFMTCQHNYAGTTGSVSGFAGRIRTLNASSNITSARTIEALSPTITAGNIVNAVGLYINNHGASGIANAYGVYAVDIAGASGGNYAIYTNAGLVRFGDRTLMPASTTAAAPLNIPHGVEPTALVDGDVWTTTAGLYVRINGSTVGPLS